jgi:CBS domain containing-hemolysin-like protein
MGIEDLTWIGIGFCLVESVLFAGLDLSPLASSRLPLEVESKSGYEAAKWTLELRQDSNFLLTMVLRPTGHARSSHSSPGRRGPWKSGRGGIR